MSTALLTDLTIFILALLVGIEVIGKVPATLHTPLMSATNAIHGIVLVGALLIGVTAHTVVGYILAFVAAVFAGANVMGGYVVTGRMLKMFRARPGLPQPAQPRSCPHSRPQRAPRRSRADAQAASPSRETPHDGFTGYIQLVYVLAAALFVVGLHLMNSPATARRGNQVAMTGMVIAVIATLTLMIHDGTVTATGWIVLIAGALIGSAIGLYAARTVQMTAMPQLVSAFNSVGGGAAALVAIYGYYDAESLAGGVLGTTTVFTVLDVLIGSVTFSGSIIAAGKLQGFVPSQPLVFKGGRLINVALAVVAIGTGAFLFSTASLPAMLILVLAALAFGVMMVLPIGGADMPVVISLLNAFTGTAVAMAGFVIGNWALIVAGALVGASGSILTKLMADAMNRSLANIIVGGFGTGDTAVAIGGPVDAQVRVDRGRRRGDPARLRVQGDHRARATAWPPPRPSTAWPSWPRLLEDRGVEVSYAIHPVAGRMPGHMNVLLAEANVPYPQLKEMDEINPEFARTDVALVIGANDVTNPAARRPGNEISGMPILDVDQAKSIIVVKRSMGRGYAGLDNELYYDPKTSMYFADAKKAMADLTAAVKTLVA